VRIKLDENLPARLARWLSGLGHETDSVPEEGLGGRPDLEIWEETQRVGRFLITQDLDFSDSRRFRPGTHHGILLIRLSNPSRRSLIDRLTMVFETEDVESWRGCFVVLTERKIRIQRPQAAGNRS